MVDTVLFSASNMHAFCIELLGSVNSCFSSSRDQPSVAGSCDGGEPKRAILARFWKACFSVVASISLLRRVLVVVDTKYSGFSCCSTKFSNPHCA